MLIVKDYKGRGISIMGKEVEMNYKPKRENAGNEPKTLSHNPNSEKYHSRSAESKRMKKDSY